MPRAYPVVVRLHTDEPCDHRIKVFARPRGYRATGYRWDVDALNAAAVLDDQTAGVIAFAATPLDRISIWVQGTTPTLQTPGVLPPRIRIDLRAGLGPTVTTLAVRRTIEPPTWTSADLAFQFAGLLASYWEIRAGTLANGVARPVQRVQVTWGVIVDSSGCCERDTVDGPWVVP